MPTNPSPSAPDPRNPRNPRSHEAGGAGIPAHPIPVGAPASAPVSDTSNPWGKPPATPAPVSDTGMYSIGVQPGEEPLRPGYRTIDGDTTVRTKTGVNDRTPSSPAINTTSQRMRRSTTSISKRNRSAGTSQVRSAASTTQMRSGETNVRTAALPPPPARSMAGMLWAVAALLAVGLTIVLLVVVMGSNDDAPAASNSDNTASNGGSNAQGNNAQGNTGNNASAQAKADVDYWWRDLNAAEQAFLAAKTLSDAVQRKDRLRSVLAKLTDLKTRASKLNLDRAATDKLSGLRAEIERDATDACVAIVESAAAKLLRTGDYAGAVALVEGVAAGSRPDLVESELMTDDLTIYLDDLAYEYGVLKRTFDQLGDDAKALALAWLPIKERFTDATIAAVGKAAAARAMADELLALRRDHNAARTIPDDMLDALEAAVSRAGELIDAEATTAMAGLPGTHPDVVALHGHLTWFFATAGQPPLNDRLIVTEYEALVPALRFVAEPGAVIEETEVNNVDVFAPLAALAQVRQLRALNVFPESVTAGFDAVVQSAMQPGYAELLDLREQENIASEVVAQVHEWYVAEFPDWEHAAEIRTWLETAERDADMALLSKGARIYQMMRWVDRANPERPYARFAWTFEECMACFLEMDKWCVENRDAPTRDSVIGVMERMLQRCFYAVVADAGSEFVRVPQFAEVIAARATTMLESRGQARQLTEQSLQRVREARERAIQFQR